MAALGGWEGAVIHEMPWASEPLEDAQLTRAYCQEKGLKVGVLDHYRIDEAYQTELAGGGLKWMQFGNAKHEHPLLGAWVHDASPTACQEAFQARQRRSDTVFLMGPAFSMVHESYLAQRKNLAAPAWGAVEAVLLTFGGGYDGGATERALDWLEAVGFTGKRVILTTGLNQSVATLKTRAAADGRIALHLNNWQPAELMGACQMAITAGGTSVYELACLGVPTVIVCTAENQWATAHAWQERSLGVSLGALETVVDELAERQIGQLIADAEKRSRLAKRSSSVIDGRGAERVAAALLGIGAQS